MLLFRLWGNLVSIGVFCLYSKVICLGVDILCLQKIKVILPERKAISMENLIIAKYLLCIISREQFVKNIEIKGKEKKKNQNYF